MQDMIPHTYIEKQGVKQTNGYLKMRKICQACMGNGYRRIYKDASESEKIVIQCAKCESTGEVEDEDFSYDYSGLDTDKLQ
jgi:Fe2+ or Zn2+ uptake regulation protein